MGKILIYTKFFYPCLGGIEKCTQDLAEYLIRKNYEVAVLTETHAESDQEIQDDEFVFQIIRVENCKARSAIRSIKTADLCISNGFSYYFIRAALKQRKKVIAIHQNYIIPIHYKKNTGIWYWIKYYFNLAVKGKRLKSTIPRTYKYLCKHLLTRKVDNVFISQFVKDQLQIPGKIIYNGTRFENFKSPRLPQKRSIGFIGRLVSDKGAIDLVKAFHASAIQDTWQLELFGEGPEYSKIEKYIKNNNLESKVLLQGRTEYEKVPEILNQIPIWVVPSRWQEPMGIVAIEILASGAHCIVRQVGGLQEMTQFGAISYYSQNELIDQLNRADDLLQNMPGKLESFPDWLKEYETMIAKKLEK